MTHESDDWEVMQGPGGADRTPEPAWDKVWRRRSNRARAVIAATTVAVLALGGTVAYAATSGGSSGSATPSASGSASPDKPGGGRHGGHWFDFGGMGVHGESTVKDQDTGKWVIRVWQRGTVEKVDGDQVTVKSEDGAEWTWAVNSDTTVLHDGTKSSGTGDLKKDETAVLVGTRSDDDTRTATRVISGTSDNRDPGGWRDGFPGGHGPRDWRMPSPSTSPSGNGATT
ncbi:hypothetical protein [Streptomyces sp. NPDC047043]|uniref:hypothetical protein n=1 Tax=Streptomyces sp. NPDC047043 TaxID=3154497 RepID=UPI0033FDA0FB